jgi:hypothetical protein
MKRLSRRDFAFRPEPKDSHPLHQLTGKVEQGLIATPVLAPKEFFSTLHFSKDLHIM